MRIYSAHLDLSTSLERALRCPGCGSAGLVAEPDDDRTSFFCTACSQCWRFDSGDVTAVDPRTCTHCRQRARCLAAREGDDVPSEPDRREERV